MKCERNLMNVSLWIDCVLVSIQDNIFRLGSSNFENGRGKSPYDPKLLTASMLIGECVRQFDFLLNIIQFSVIP